MQNYEFNKIYIIRLICHSLKQKSQPENKKLAWYFSKQKKIQAKNKKKD